MEWLPEVETLLRPGGDSSRSSISSYLKRVARPRHAVTLCPTRNPRSPNMHVHSTRGICERTSEAELPQNITNTCSPQGSLESNLQCGQAIKKGIMELGWPAGNERGPVEHMDCHREQNVA